MLSSFPQLETQRHEINFKIGFTPSLKPIFVLSFPNKQGDLN